MKLRRISTAQQVAVRGRAAAAFMLAAVALAACGEDDPGQQSAPVVRDPGPIHVHGLGVNPGDGALFIATHTGLFRTPAGETTAERVGDRYQDTMGFTVVGPNRFLGSGHPDGRDGLPPFLGLVESTDAGASWEPVSLLGRADFHVLEAAGARVYGFGSDFESRRSQFLVSDDGGRNWDERQVPEPFVALAIDPDDPDRVVASDGIGLYASTDAGRRWEKRGEPGGLLAWPEGGELTRVTASGAAARSRDAGRTWRRAGRVGGKPSAFDGAGDDLVVALHDGTVRQSSDGGRTWAVRSRP